MKTIWKFQAEIADNIKITMPEGAKVLSVEPSASTSLNVWALVDDEAPMIDRKFSLRGTGHKADGLEDLPFIGTCIFMGGAFVVHLFDGAPNA